MSTILEVLLNDTAKTHKAQVYVCIFLFSKLNCEDTTKGKVRDSKEINEN